MRTTAPQLRLALRSLGRSPAFAFTAVLTLALGIGVLAAVFSVVDAVLLRPLPYRQAENLVAIWETDATSGDAWRVTGATYSDWRGAPATFDSLAAFGNFGGTLLGAGDPHLLRGSRVTANYFETLGVSPLVGRFFAPQDVEASVPVAVLGNRLWQERFGGATDVVGRSIVVDATTYAVIGVAPDELFPTWPVNGPRMHFRHESQDLWVPLPLARLDERRSHVLGVIGRLAAGTTIDQAEAALQRLAGGGRADERGGAVVRPLADEAVGEVRPTLHLLLAAAAVVLLAAIASAGGLVLARALSRRRENAVRRALGASFRTLVRHQLVESLVLAAAATVAGCALAAGALPVLLSWVPRDVPRLDTATIDWRALGVAATVALLASLGLAFLTLLQERRSAPADSLMGSSLRAGTAAGAHRTNQVLVATQVALAVALTIAATLLVKSYRHLESTSLGVSTERVLVVDLALSPLRYDRPEKAVGFLRELLARVAAGPDVLGAHLAYDHPLETNWIDSFALAGRLPDENERWTAELRFATPDLFDDLGVPVVAGREFVADDRPGGRPVALVNQAFARRFLGRDDAVGATLRSAVATYTWGEGAPTEFEIVGIVGDITTPGLDRTAEPCFYLDVWQVPMHDVTLMIRTRRDPELAVPSVRSVVSELDRDQALGSIRTLEFERQRAVAQPRFSMRLMTVFGATVLALAALGIHGLLAGWVASRRRELGVRAAVGAGRAALLSLVLRRGLKLAAFGIAAGSLAALALARILATQLRGVASTDGASYLMAATVVLASALLACLVPALRAVRTDPAAVLRED